MTLKVNTIDVAMRKLVNSHHISLSHRRGTARSAMSVEIMSVAAHLYKIVLTARGYDRATYAVALCLSVCMSVTSRCSTKTVKRKVTKIMSYSNPWTLTPKILVKLQWSDPNGGARYRVG